MGLGVDNFLSEALGPIVQVRAGLNPDGISVERSRIDIRRIVVENVILAALEALYLLIHVQSDE